MAGLVCAARARELGLRPRVLEKGTRPGGSMLLSSCVIWRHIELDAFRAECPGGDEALQRLVWERLDDALAWVVSLGAEPVWEDTENPRTTGKRFDPLWPLIARDVVPVRAAGADQTLLRDLRGRLASVPGVAPADARSLLVGGA